MSNDPVVILKERLAKAEAKSARHKKAWEASEVELSDLRTTLRVLIDVLNPDNAVKTSDTASTGDRQRLIASMLGTSKDKAKAPADLFSSYRMLSDEDINIETFRTTVWRMKDRIYDLANGRWVVEGENGQYWKRAIIAGDIEQVFGTSFQASPKSDVDFVEDDELIEEEDYPDHPF